MRFFFRSCLWPKKLIKMVTWVPNPFKIKGERRGKKKEGKKIRNSRKSVKWSAIRMPCLSRLCSKLKGEQGSGPRVVIDLCFWAAAPKGPMTYYLGKKSTFTWGNSAFMLKMSTKLGASFLGNIICCPTLVMVASIWHCNTLLSLNMNSNKMCHKNFFVAFYHPLSWYHSFLLCQLLDFEKGSQQKWHWDLVG